jgi:hypothetical protein
MVSVVPAAISAVCPSGRARATDWTPMMVLPPGLFSTCTGAPSASLIRSAISRVSTSVLPPGANGTTIVTGRDGKAGWAAAERGRSRDGGAARPARDASKRRREAALGIGSLHSELGEVALWQQRAAGGRDVPERMSVGRRPATARTGAGSR